MVRSSYTGRELCWLESDHVKGHFCHRDKGHTVGNHLMMTRGPDREYLDDEGDEPKLSAAQALILFEAEAHPHHMAQVAGARRRAAARLVALKLATIHGPGGRGSPSTIKLNDAGVALARKLRPPERRFRRAD